jgi:acetyl esterase/lipase
MSLHPIVLMSSPSVLHALALSRGVGSWVSAPRGFGNVPAALSHDVLPLAACGERFKRPVAVVAHTPPSGLIDVRFFSRETTMADPAFELRPALTYATHDGVALQGDLYLPRRLAEAAGAVPALIAVHGGGWQQGARSAFQHWGPYLAARGYALFAISYRFAKKGKKTFPESVRDVLAAIQYLRGNATGLGIDSARIGLFGASAGAHLSALAALGARSPAIAGGYPDDPVASVDTAVKVLVGVYGVYDLVEMWQAYRANSPLDNNIENFIGAAPMENRQVYFDASPVSYATYANNNTAVLLACGTEDDLVDRKVHTDAFLRALKQAGFFARTCIVQGAGHYWISDPLDEPGSFTAFFAPRLMRFLAEKL